MFCVISTCHKKLIISTCTVSKWTADHSYDSSPAVGCLNWALLTFRPLVLRLIMPQPEWWPTRRWPPRTPTEKDSQLYHTVKDFKSILYRHFRKTWERCWSESKWCWRRHSMLNLGMAMWLLVNMKIIWERSQELRNLKQLYFVFSEIKSSQYLLHWLWTN